jgi:hypothetical protein
MAAAVSLGRRLVGGGGVHSGHLLRRCSGPRRPRTPTMPGGQVATAGTDRPNLDPDGPGRVLPLISSFLDSDDVPDPLGFLSLHKGIWGICPGFGGGGRLLRRRWPADGG